jgi:hypothetical protein
MWTPKLRKDEGGNQWVVTKSDWFGFQLIPLGSDLISSPLLEDKHDKKTEPALFSVFEEKKKTQYIIELSAK